MKVKRKKVMTKRKKEIIANYKDGSSVSDLATQFSMLKTNGLYYSQKQRADQGSDSSY